MPDIEEFLQPISEASPSGEDVRYEIVYDEIREARDADPLRGPERGGPKEPDYRDARKLAEDVLRTQSKHLQIAAWLAEAWVNLEGVSGLTAGLDLERRLLEDFWETVYPEIDEGDLEFRVAPLEWLAGYLGPSLRSVPLTLSGFDSMDFQVSRDVGTEEACEGDKEKLKERQAKIDEGKMPAEDFDEAVVESGKGFYKKLIADLAAATQSIEALEALTDEKFGQIGPSFRTLRDQVEGLRRIADPLLQKCLELDPDPIEVDPVGEEDAAAPVGDDGGVPIEPVSRKDAGVRIAAAAKFLRQDDPHNPASYLMIRGLRWGELRKGGGGVEPRLLAAPPTATRTRLKGLLLDAKWAELLETAEGVMATPFGRGWLDLQRYVFTALGGLGSDYDAVEKSLKGTLRSLLVDLPELPDLTLMDDTPTANRETQMWLREEGLLGPLTEEEQARLEAGAPTVAASGRDVAERARERARSGQPEKGIEMLMHAAEQARGNRDRLMRRVEAAGIMLDHGLAPVAHPILEEFLQRLEAHQLKEWEDPETVASPMALMYRCLDQMGGDEVLKEQLYLEVCRLDPMQAIHFASQEAEDDAEEVADGGPEES
ncbi:MAG: type VI secretion system protein TssA [Gemmatimonadetes bacterium]|nr:type VI secretion system protein TssA [Gemmatimonadota bacterium]